MLFHSVGFLLIFLPLFLVLVHLSTKGRPRSLLLLFFSYFFYSGAEPAFVFLLMLSSVTDFTVALKISGTNKKNRKLAWLYLSLVVNLGLLAFYKYGGWVTQMMSLGYSDFFQGYVLPAGISFYTFQSLAYTIDVYREKIQPEKSLVSFCNYVAYLPQLIAGPIERYSHLAPQLESFRAKTSKPEWTAGIDRIMLGIAQKLILADGCGYIVDRLIEMNATDFFSSWAIAIGFGLQIYFDFAAYSHMAIGISLLLGVRLSENFLAPYQAVNIQDFWRRWHVTLSSWFRDYLYISLGGSHHGLLRTIINVVITFVLCGLWHGAGLNFLLWGFLHGCLLGLYRLKMVLLPNIFLPGWIAVPVTYVVISFVWVPFRIAEWPRILTTWSGMIGINGIEGRVVSIMDLVFIGLLACFCFLIPHAAKRWPGSSGWQESALLALLASFAIFNSPSITQFIYFQF